MTFFIINGIFGLSSYILFIGKRTRHKVYPNSDYLTCFDKESDQNEKKKNCFQWHKWSWKSVWETHADDIIEGLETGMIRKEL